MLAVHTEVGGDLVEVDDTVVDGLLVGVVLGDAKTL